MRSSDWSSDVCSSDLVKGAIGFDAARGDMVAIGQRPFVKVEDAEPAFWDQGWFLPLVKQVGAILAALLAFLFVGRPLIKAAKARAAVRAERDAAVEEDRKSTRLNSSP